MKRGIAILTLVVVAAAVALSLSSSGSNFNTRASGNIRRLCGERPNCRVRLYDLFRDWNTPISFDTFYDFDSSLSDTDISKVIGTEFHGTRELEHVIIRMRGNHVVSSEAIERGIEGPLRSEVSVNCWASHAHYVSCPAGAVFAVHPSPTKGDPARFFSLSGVSYKLTQVP